MSEPTLREQASPGLRSTTILKRRVGSGRVFAVVTSEKRAAIAALCSRPAYGVELLKAIADQKIPKTDLSADLVRQLHNLKNEGIDKMLGDVWGQVRTTAADKAALIATYEQMQSLANDIPVDPSLGRAVFAKTCQQCHTLYGVGKNIGPDLTGSNRSDLEYLLTNIVDPSALIAKEYQPTFVTTIDGRVITGIVTAENDKSVTVRTATETLILPKNEIDERTLSETSMMPEDQLKQFSPHEILSLFAYLRGKSQVPMLATKENAGQFFNGTRSDRLDRRSEIVVGRKRRNRRPQPRTRAQHVSAERSGGQEFPAVARS